MRRERRTEVAAESLNTFGKAGREYLALDATKAPKTRKKHEWLFACLERLHGKPLSGIKTADIVAECRR